MKARLMFYTFVFLAFFLTPTFAYTISGDMITYEGNLGKVTQEPYLLTDLSNEVELTFTSDFPDTEYLDIAFGFNVPDAQPTTALYYNPHTVYTPRSYTCEEYANWTTSPNYMWCWKNLVIDNDTMETEHHLVFEHAFDTGEVETKTIYWNDEREEDWTDISNKFETIPYEWNGKNTWYVVENVEFIPDVMKTLRLNIDVLPNTAGKYDIFIKRNADTFNWAISNNQYLLLDPWWNTSWNYCKNITITNGKADHPSYTNVTYSANMQSDFGDLRFLNAECGDSGSVLSYFLRNKTDTAWATYDVLLDGTQNISVYYGNVGAASLSSITDVWGADMKGYWTFDIGSGTGAADISGGSHTGTITGSGWNASGVKGGMLDIGSGEVSIITVGDHADFEPANTFTIVTWIRRNGDSGQFTRVFEKYYGAGSPYGSYNLNLWDGAGGVQNRPATAVGNGGISAYAFDTTLTDSVWTMVATTYNTSHVLQYQDGALDGTPHAEADTISYSAGDLTIGNRVGSGNQFEGWLDEVMFFTRALTATELSDIYAATEPSFTFGAEQSAPGGHVAPRWSVNSTVFPATYDATNTTLSITWANGSSAAPVNVSDVNITSNYSGSDVTYEIALISGDEWSGVYNLTALVGAGAYYWNSTANNNNSQPNSTDTWVWTISKHNTLCTIYANGLSNNDHVTFPNPILVYGTCDNPEGSWGLWNNHTNISHLNNTNTVYGVDVPVFKSNVTGTDNYTANDTFVLLIIDQGNLTNASYTNITYNISDPQSVDVPVLVTCNIPIGISSNEFGLYNDTDKIGNTSGVQVSTTAKTMNYTCNSTGNTNWTAGSATNTFTWNLAGSFQIPAVYDEKTLAALTFNLTLYNDTFSSLSTDITSYNNDTVKGEMTALLSADGYASRTYYMTIPSGANDSYNITGYMVDETDGQWVSITVKTFKEQNIEDVSIDFLRIFAGGQVIVAQGKTDATGSFPFHLDPTYDYALNLAATGYDTKNTSLIPVSTSYDVYLSSDLWSMPTYWSFFRNITTSCGYTNATRFYQCNWTDTSSQLTEMNLIVREQNLTSNVILCNNTSVSAIGTLDCTFSAPANKTFSAVLIADFGDASIALNTFTWTDILVVSFGITGVVMALLIVLFAGTMGFQLESPIATILLTIAGLGLSYIWNFITLPTTGFGMFAGLLLAGGILIYKMR